MEWFHHKNAMAKSRKHAVHRVESTDDGRNEKMKEQVNIMAPFFAAAPSFALPSSIIHETFHPST